MTFYKVKPQFHGKEGVPVNGSGKIYVMKKLELLTQHELDIYGFAKACCTEVQVSKKQTYFDKDNSRYPKGFRSFSYPKNVNMCW